jgi:hypothetical protein
MTTIGQAACDLRTFTKGEFSEYVCRLAKRVIGIEFNLKQNDCV